MNPSESLYILTLFISADNFSLNVACLVIFILVSPIHLSEDTNKKK